MEYNDLSSLIANNTTLVKTNAKLVEVNREAIIMAKENKDLLLLNVEIYQTLSDKKERSLLEQSWYLGLQKVMHKRNDGEI